MSGKTFKRTIVTKDQLADITSQQIQTAPPAAAEPAITETAPVDAGKRGRPRRDVPIVTFNMRLPADVVDAIDAARGGLVSRNGWVAMAIGEKLKRE